MGATPWDPATVALHSGDHIAFLLLEPVSLISAASRFLYLITWCHGIYWCWLLLSLDGIISVAPTHHCPSSQSGTLHQGNGFVTVSDLPYPFFYLQLPQSCHVFARNCGRVPSYEGHPGPGPSLSFWPSCRCHRRVLQTHPSHIKPSGTYCLCLWISWTKDTSLHPMRPLR